jgi:UDP-glucose:(heptosyl)LPS alpha-1,3-glucosyltransferase
MPMSTPADEALQRLRVALVLERFDPTVGGLEAWTWGFAHALHDRGHQVTIVASEFSDSATPFRLHRFTSDRSPRERAHCVATALRSLDVDIVHDAGCGWAADVLHPHAGSQVLSLDRNLASLPWRKRARHLLSPALRRWRADLQATERVQMANATRVVAVSESVRHDLMHRYDIQPHRLALVPNGIDTHRFVPAKRDAQRAEARRSLRIEDEVVFLSVAVNFALKGVDVTLAALAHLVRAHSKVKLIVAGSGPIEEYRRRAARLGVASAVSFLGHVDDVPRLHAAADVYLHPTFHDACSLATLEALASGLPVITTRRNGAADAMSSDREGYVLDRAGDVAALAQAMRALLDPRRREDCGTAAAALGRDRSFERNCLGILAVYDEVLRAGGSHPRSREPADRPS